jgi:hypothetical protein
VPTLDIAGKNYANRPERHDSAGFLPERPEIAAAPARPAALPLCGINVPFFVSWPAARWQKKMRSRRKWWRPNLPDEADNHLIELAMAGGAAAIITHNVRDIRRGELLLNGLRVHTPAEYLEETR